jgi:2-hydroxychromene-2-carboxylate isomerase
MTDIAGEQSMTKTIEFLFDFGGPNSYLAHKMLPDLAARTGAQVTYVPILLGGLFKITNNQAPMMRYAETPAKRDYELLEFSRFVKAHQIPFTMNPHFPINSITLMRGAVAAQHLGCFLPYVEAIMTAMWEDGANTGDLAVVKDVLDKAGLDSAAILTKAEDTEIKAELATNTEKAAARGAFGVPTFFIGNEMFWGKERLGQVEAALTKA